MSLSIGRFGLGPTLTTELRSWDQDGDTISTDGNIICGSEVDAEACRQQLLGIVNSDDEPVVPVIWSRDLAATGAYSVTSGKVSAVQGVSYDQHFFTYELTLQRATNGYTAQMCESLMSGNDRSIKPAGVTAVSWHALPTAATMYDLDALHPVPVLRQGPGGWVFTFTSAHDYYSATPTFLLPPANWYDMAATVKVAGQAVCGRQVVSNPTNWELSNGLVKVTPHAAHLFDVTSPVFATPSNWGTAKGVQAGYFDGTNWQSVFPAQSFVVLRTAPEEAAIRLPAQVTVASGTTTVNVDISLRRGARMATVRLTSPWATRWGIGFDTTTACTSLTSGGGTKQTTADGDGNKAVMLSALSATPDNTAGRIYAAGSAFGHDLAIGHEVGGASSAAPDRGTDLRDQWFAATNETQRVVAQ